MKRAGARFSIPFENVKIRQLEQDSVSPTAVIVYLENIGFFYPAMSMMVIGPSLLY
jgi:hypothetical protein